MTNIVAAQVGSGTIPFVRAILPSGQRGSDNTGLAAGVRTGIQVMVGNPEDIVSVDAFASSGIAVGITPTKIFGASQSLLPRVRTVLVQNATDSSILYVAHTASKVISEGWQLVNGIGIPRASVELPIMAGADIWAAGSTVGSGVQARLLIF
jgi:hypothetical protein